MTLAFVVPSLVVDANLVQQLLGKGQSLMNEGLYVDSVKGPFNHEDGTVVFVLHTQKVMEILLYPHPLLETRAVEVTVFDGNLRQLCREMHKARRLAEGIGLAANQVGRLLRVVVIEIPPEPELTLINPKIVNQEGSIPWEEGCLSFPGLGQKTQRSARVSVRAFNPYGKELAIEADGLLAICLQHEIDHLDGVVFLKREWVFVHSDRNNNG